MKKIFKILVMIITVFLCYTCYTYIRYGIRYNNEFDTASEPINFTDSLHASILYDHTFSDQGVDIHCKDLKGLGQLHIGETTLKQCKNDFQKNYYDTGWYKKGSANINESINLYKLHDYNNIVDKFYDTPGCYSFDKFEKYLEKNASNIKQIEIKNYKIGEIYIGEVNCIFYNDTLVAILYDCSAAIKYHYISKYGSGKGFEKGFSIPYIQFDFQKDKREFEISEFIKIKHNTKHTETRLWSNDNISLEFKSYFHETDTYKSTSDRYGIDGRAVIISNSNYNDFLKELDKYMIQYGELRDAEWNEEKNKRQKSFEQI